MNGTHESRLRDMIQAKMEDTATPDAILAYLKTREGKPITKRDVDKLKESLGDSTIYLSTRYGMTHLEWGNYHASGGRKGGSLLLAYQDKNVRIDSSFVEAMNACYYAAARERNAQRAAVLANPELIARLATAMREHDESVRTIGELTGWDKPFHVARFEIRDMLAKVD